jgi:hypothetical protein
MAGDDSTGRTEYTTDIRAGGAAGLRMLFVGIGILIAMVLLMMGFDMIGVL